MRFAKRLLDSYDRLTDRIIGRFARAAQKPYLEYCFAAMGRIAKSTGRVEASHIEQAEKLIESLGWRGAQRRQAIRWFDAGKASEVDFHQLAARCARSQQDELKTVVLECLVRTALVQPSTAANRTLTLLTSLLGADNQKITGLRAQADVNDAAEADAIALFELTQPFSEQELKLAYRRLASRYHPDKLGPDASESERAYSATRSAEVRAAYELLLPLSRSSNAC